MRYQKGLNKRNSNWLTFYAIQALNFLKVHALEAFKTSVLFILLAFAIFRSLSFKHMPPLVYPIVMALGLSTLLLGLYRFMHKDRRFLDQMMNQWQRRKDRLAKNSVFFLVATFLSGISICLVNDKLLFSGLFLVAILIQYGLRSLQTFAWQSPRFIVFKSLQPFAIQQPKSLTFSFLYIHIMQVLRVNALGTFILLAFASLVSLILIELSAQGIFELKIWHLSLLSLFTPMLELSENFFDKGFLSKTGFGWIRPYFFAKLTLHTLNAVLLIACLGFYYYMRHYNVDGYAFAITFLLGILFSVLASLLTTALRFWIPNSALYRSLLFIIIGIFPPIILLMTFGLKGRRKYVGS